jgi:leukotriene-A4 hydrolase
MRNRTLFNQPRQFTGVIILLAFSLMFGGCAEPSPDKNAENAARTESMPRDIHTLSRPDRVKVTHGVFDWTTDFDAKQIRGSVTWSFERQPGHEEAPLVLDTHGLTIQAVVGADGTPRDFEMGSESPSLGTPLIIHINAEDTRIQVDYHTGPESDGIQWLAPEQTAGGEHPFLFSQAQSILARTFLPCQDSPGVRITFDASVRAPDGLTAVMAAEMLPGGGDGEPFKFKMPQPIPSYLIAIAVGDIEFRELGKATGVYAEPSVIDAAADEFADTEKMLVTAEKLFGPYRWDRYDIIVLPPSFPFGGMENPRLTFATPTILAGDKSLVSLIAHELAHSWSGNLVTNATWADFWLNEGFTVYLERRIQESLYGELRAEMEAVLGKQDLLDGMKDLEPGFTTLHNTSLEGRNPDDAFSDVPYEKGYLLLRLVEGYVGREKFDKFLRSWFDDNAFKSLTTSDFELALKEKLFAGDAGAYAKLKLNEWFYEPGLPDNAPEPKSDAFRLAEVEAAAFVAGEKIAADLPGDSWSTHEWLRMLRSLPEDLPASKMAELDSAWSLTGSGNSEILSQWLIQSVHSDYAKAYPALESFLTRQGRRKFLKPLYTALASTESGKARAEKIYAKARPTYHSVSSDTIDDILGYEGS